jgi:hypothetical protein
MKKKNKDKATGVLFLADGSIKEIIFKGLQVTLEEMKKCVGGYVEFVHLEDDLVLVVNEEGLILNLPHNKMATRILLSLGGKANYIVGDTLLISNRFIK